MRLKQEFLQVVRSNGGSLKDAVQLAWLLAFGTLADVDFVDQNLTTNDAKQKLHSAEFQKALAEATLLQHAFGKPRIATATLMEILGIEDPGLVAVKISQFVNSGWIDCKLDAQTGTIQINYVAVRDVDTLLPQSHHLLPTVPQCTKRYIKDVLTRWLNCVEEVQAVVDESLCGIKEEMHKVRADEETVRKELSRTKSPNTKVKRLPPGYYDVPPAI